MSTHTAGIRRQPMSAEAIRTYRLRRSRRLAFGYDPDAVDAFLDRVADEVAARDTAYSDMAAELARVKEELYSRRHGVLPSVAGDFDPARVEERLRMQRYVEELLNSAQRNAAQLVEQGRMQAGHILAQAHAAADQAARDYRRRAGVTYTADREELARLAALARLVLTRYADIQKLLDAANGDARVQLGVILDRIEPVLTGADPNRWEAPAAT